MLGKFASIIGPILVGTTVMLARSLGASPDLASRISISSIAILFITGGILLLFVDEHSGKQEAGFL